jgi:hypothetical protein
MSNVGSDSDNSNEDSDDDEGNDNQNIANGAGGINSNNNNDNDNMDNDDDDDDNAGKKSRETSGASNSSMVETELACQLMGSVSSVTASAAATSSASRCEIVNVASTTEGMIANCVNTSIYPFMKFITSEAQLDPNYDHFGKKIMTELKIAKESQELWWHSFKQVAKKALNQKRSSVGAAVKKSVIGKNGRAADCPNDASCWLTECLLFS